MAYWQDLGVKEIPIGGFRGLHETVASDKRPLGVLKSVRNMAVVKEPALSTRDGLTALGSAGSGVVNGIHVYRKKDGTEQLLRHVGTVLERWDGTAWVSAGTGLPDAPSTSANLNNVLAIFTGSTAKSWNGSTLSNLSGAPQANFVVEAYQQLHAANVSGKEATVFTCDLGLPTTWTPSPTNNAEERIVSNNPVKWIDHDPYQRKVLIWTTREQLAYLGPETGDRPGDWSIVPVSQFGTPAGRTVKNLKGVWIWLTRNDEARGFAVWNGGQPSIIRDEIAASLDLIDWANIANATAFTDKKGRYHCCAPKSGGGVLWFTYDPKHGWSTGDGADIRAHATFPFNGEDKAVVGGTLGYVYTVEGTTDNGTAIPWEMELETSFDDAFRDKHLLQMRVLCSASTGAMFTVALSTDTGATYETAKTLSPSTRPVPILIPMPIASGGSRKASMFTLKLSGTGVVTIHDILFRYRTVRG